MSRKNFSPYRRKEIDLRTEFFHTMNGTNQEIAKGQSGLLRKFRKDKNNNKVRCVCIDSVTDEPVKDTLCNYCHGEKYLWDEEPIKFYLYTVQTESQLADREVLRQPGTMVTDFYVVYLPASVSLTEDDKIVRLELDKEGSIVLPRRRKELIRIVTLREMRLDNGRLEYWKANGFAENRNYL